MTPEKFFQVFTVFPNNCGLKKIIKEENLLIIGRKRLPKQKKGCGFLEKVTFGPFYQSCPWKQQDKTTNSTPILRFLKVLEKHEKKPFYFLIFFLRSEKMKLAQKISWESFLFFFQHLFAPKSIVWMFFLFQNIAAKPFEKKTWETCPRKKRQHFLNETSRLW